MAEKCKPYWTWRIGDAYEEAYFNKKNLYNWAKNKFVSMSLGGKKKVSGVETHRLK